MNNIRLFIRRSLENYPIITNSILYGTLFVAAEFSQQTVTKMKDKSLKAYDKPVIIRYSLYGTFIAGPILSNWYRFLDRTFAGTSSKIIVKKLLVDQFFFTPQLLVIFYVAMSVMEGKSDIFEECKTKIIPTFKTSCMFWLPAQTINFLIVPSIYRVSYIAVSSFAWINILCWIKRQSSETSL